MTLIDQLSSLLKLSLNYPGIITNYQSMVFVMPCTVCSHDCMISLTWYVTPSVARQSYQPFYVTKYDGFCWTMAIWCVELEVGVADRLNSSPNCPIYTHDKGKDESSKQLDVTKCLTQTCFDDALNRCRWDPAWWLVKAQIWGVHCTRRAATVIAI